MFREKLKRTSTLTWRSRRVELIDILLYTTTTIGMNDLKLEKDITTDGSDDGDDVIFRTMDGHPRNCHSLTSKGTGGAGARGKWKLKQILTKHPRLSSRVDPRPLPYQSTE